MSATSSEQPPDSLPDPAELAERIAMILRDGDIAVDGLPCDPAPTPSDTARLLLPILGAALTRTPRHPRGLAGIVAPPGAGKSVVLAWLAAAARAMQWRHLAFLSLDGYHLPNAVLDTMRYRSPDGAESSLRQYKGIPETFDAAALAGDLAALQSDRAPRRLPRYSRVSHDPEPDSICVDAETEWVFVEGNFLFLDAPVWRDMRDRFDCRIYLDADDAVLQERLFGRHRRGGKPPEHIRAHFDRVDGPNIRRVRASRRYAGLAFHWDTAQGWQPAPVD